MGGKLSVDEVSNVAFLQQLADPTPAPLYDTPLFWSEGFASLAPLQLMLFDAEQLQLALGPFLLRIYESSTVTRRYLQLFKSTAAVVDSAAAGELPPYFINMLVLVRTATKHLIEVTNGHPEEALFAYGIGKSILQGLLAALVNFTSHVTLKAATFVAHAEVLTLLLVMCGTQLFIDSVTPAIGGVVSTFEGGPSPLTVEQELPSNDVFIDALLSLPHTTLQSLVLVLMHHYTAYCMSKGSAVDRSYLTSTFSLIFSSIGKQAVSLALLPIYAMRAVFGGATASNSNPPVNISKTDGHPPPAGELVGRRSALLLLVLAFYRKNAPTPNAVLAALSSFRNSRASEDEDDDMDSDCEAGFGGRQESNTFLLHGVRSGHFEIDFARLYLALTKSSGDEEHPLLLYVLLHENPAFLEFTIHREDLPTLLEPILRSLYHVDNKYVNTVYMQLIILLMLSQHGAFNSNVHMSTLSSVTWYKERCLNNISLGSLLVAVLIRVVQYNLQHTKDNYLSTNCLATLANMAPFFHQMHAYASQRLVLLLGMLCRKLLRLQNTPNCGPDVVEEVEIYSEFLRTSLQCINACITYTLPRNLYLVYELIHQGLPLEPLAVNPKLGDLVHNIQKVLNYFEREISYRLSNNPEQDFSIEDIMSLLAQGLEGWKGDGLKVFDETKFKYEEEANPEEFFIPYVWDLVVFNMNKHPAKLWRTASLPLLADATFSLSGEEWANEVNLKALGNHRQPSFYATTGEGADVV